MYVVSASYDIMCHERLNLVPSRARGFTKVQTEIAIVVRSHGREVFVNVPFTALNSARDIILVLFPSISVTPCQA